MSKELTKDPKRQTKRSEKTRSIITFVSNCDAKDKIKQDWIKQSPFRHRGDGGSPWGNRNRTRRWLEEAVLSSEFTRRRSSSAFFLLPSLDKGWDCVDESPPYANTTSYLRSALIIIKSLMEILSYTLDGWRESLLSFLVSTVNGKYSALYMCKAQWAHIIHIHLSFLFFFFFLFFRKHYVYVVSFWFSKNLFSVWTLQTCKNSVENNNSTGQDLDPIYLTNLK